MSPRQTELAAGVRGELIVRGPSLFSGYDGASADATPVIDADGFFHTGDLCSIDTAGRLRYHGRLADMLFAEGRLFPALDIESVLATHPAIKLAQVLEVDLPGSPRAIAAFVELVPRASLTPDDVLAFCARRLPSAKVPLQVRFVKNWPMSTTKVQKFRLREQLADEHSDDLVNRT